MRETMETVFAHWSEIPLIENHIRQLHRDLLRHSTKDERHRGSYKTLRNDVAAFAADGKEIGRRIQDGHAVRHAATDGCARGLG